MVTARFQLNIMVDSVDGLDIMKNVKKAFVPVMWFEDKGGVPNDMVFKMKLLANLPDILAGTGWVQIGVAAGMVILAMVVHITRRRDDQNPILSQSIAEDSQDENVFLSGSEE